MGLKKRALLKDKAIACGHELQIRDPAVEVQNVFFFLSTCLAWRMTSSHSIKVAEVVTLLFGWLAVTGPRRVFVCPADCVKSSTSTPVLSY